MLILIEENVKRDKFFFGQDHADMKMTTQETRGEQRKEEMFLAEIPLQLFLYSFRNKKFPKAKQFPSRCHSVDQH